MADNKDGPSRGANFLLAAGVGAGAFAYSVKNMPRGTEKPTKDIRVTSQNKLIKQIQHVVGSSYNPANFNKIRAGEAINYINRMEHTFSPFSPSSALVAREWQAAIEAVVPADLRAGLYSMGTSPSEALEYNLTAIKQSIRNNPSLYTFDIFNRFRSNMNAIETAGGMGQVGIRTPAIRDQVNNFLARQVETPLQSMRGAFSVRNVSTLQKGLSLQRVGELTSTSLVSTLQQIQNRLGTSMDISRRSVDGINAGELVVHFGEDLSLNLPEAFGPNKGLVRMGSNLHNIYSPGTFSVMHGGAVTPSMSFPEYKAWSVLQELNKAGESSSREAFRKGWELADEAADKLSEFQEPNLGNDFNLLTKFRAQQLTVLDENGRSLRGEDLRKFVEDSEKLVGKQVYPVSSKKSRFSLIDPETAYGGFHGSIDYGRKPWQWIKPYSPTDEAIEAMRKLDFGGNRWDFLESPLAKEELGGTSAPRLKAAYISPEQIEALHSRGYMIGDGEFLIRDAEHIRKASQVKSRTSIELVELSKELSDALTANTGKALSQLTRPIKSTGDIPLPEILGRDAIGRLVTRQQGMKLMGFAPTAGRSPGSGGMRLFIDESIDTGAAQKRFGTLKGMAIATDFDAMARDPEAMMILGIESLHDVDVIGSVKDLEKAQHSRLMQKYSRIVELSRQAERYTSKGLAAGVKPEEVLQAIVRESTSAVGLLDVAAVEDKFGQLISQLPAELSGQVETIAGQFSKTGSHKAAIGIANIAFGGTKEGTGAGNIGTLEPRIFSLLEGGAYGPGAADVSKELQTRLLLNEPEKLLVHQELRKTLQTLEGTVPKELAEANANVVNPWALDKDARETFFRKGGLMATGLKEGPSSIYYPGYDTLNQIKPYLTSGGEVVSGGIVAKEYSQLYHNISAAHRGEMSEEQLARLVMGGKDEAGKRIGGFAAVIAKHHAPAGKGLGSLARGELMGSRSMTGVSNIKQLTNFYKEIGDLPEHIQQRTVGIPEYLGRQMFEELESVHGASWLKDFQQGKLVPGMVARHPFIGPYSTQPVYMKMIATNEPAMIIPESIKQFKFGGETVDFQTGILRGMAGDKDADTFMAIAFSKQNTEKVRLMMEDSNRLAEEYFSHSFVMQALKGKAGVEGDLPLSKYLAGHASKLVTAQSEVGRISLSLTKARAAITSSNLDQASQTRSLSLLEWLEQQPISGKHLKIANVLSGDFERQLSTVGLAVGTSQPDLLEGAVKEMVNLDTMTGDKRRMVEGLLGEGITLDGGTKVNGLRLSETSENIAKAMEQFQLTGKEVQASRMHSLMRGETFNMGDITEYLKATDLASESAVSAKGLGGLAEASKQALADMNKAVSEVANKVRPFAKPLAIGAMAAIGTGMLFSGSPKAMMSPSPPLDRGPEGPSGVDASQLPGGSSRGAFAGAQLKAVTELSRPSNTARDEVHAPQAAEQIRGSPTSPGMGQGSNYDLSRRGPKHRQAIRATIEAKRLQPGDRANLMNRLGSSYSGANMQVNVRDDRRSLNSTTLNDMLND